MQADREEDLYTTIGFRSKAGDILWERLQKYP